MNYFTFSDAWLNTLTDVIENGRASSPRGQQTLELLWCQIGVLNSLSFPVAVESGREFRDVIGVLEGLSLVGQCAIPEAFTDRIKKFGNFLDSGVFHGSYGSRVYGRLGDLVELLRLDPDSRQAVLSIYDSRSDLGAKKRDIPCTIALQFLRGWENGLDLKVMMRSNDLWLGTPYDFMQFAILQASVAQALGLMPGTYIHSVGSLHLYDRDEPKTMELEPRDTTVPFPFPLWGGEGSITDISARARRLLLYPMTFQPETVFEQWARELLIR